MYVSYTDPNTTPTAPPTRTATTYAAKPSSYSPSTEAVGTVDLRFRNEYVRFENWEPNTDETAFGFRAASDNADTAVAIPDAKAAAADAAALGLASTASGPNTSFLSPAGADEAPF